VCRFPDALAAKLEFVPIDFSTLKSGKAQLFIDRHVAFRRDEQSSAGVNREEIEANQLGAAL